MLATLVEELRQCRYTKRNFFFPFCYVIFDPQCPFYRSDTYDVKELFKTSLMATEKWRSELTVGDKVDALMLTKVAKFSPQAWVQGKIIEIDEEKDSIVIQMTQIPEIQNGQLTGKSPQITGERWNMEIAEFESKTKLDYNWRKNYIKVGTLVDAFDYDKWYESTILQIKVEDENTIVQIAYRVYRTMGTKLKLDVTNNKTYEGWDSRYDEWISIYNPRIQPHLSKTIQTASARISIKSDIR